MKTIIKKNYEKPTVDIIVMKVQTQLMQASTEEIPLVEEPEVPNTEQW